ncbi:hypothetical protein MAR_026729 [Mya arenaria]|uniref:Uncharacterized protein n=1 Tax=Mya arenaria TaxID=6604 RepID=A0ABY7EUC8_MYAAR|nr:hypothetical protein MAR_026729 [Mya arenaria]
MSNAERVARWRQRQREDPSKHEAYKRKERERYEQKKKRGVVKPIAELSKRDQRSKRKQWRQSSNKYYIRKQRILTVIENTETPAHSPENNQVQAARRMGRKKVRRDRSKAYREIFKLRIALKKEERLKEKHKKRFQRQKNSKEDKRQKEEEAVIKGHNIRKAVLLYSVIVNRLRKRYKMTKTHTEKRNIASLVCATGLIRRYRLADYARKMIGVTTHQMKRKPRRQQIHIKATRARKAVHSFFERDDNSRIKADKKATITRKGEKKQIRLLNDDIKNLHSKYNSEMGNRQISYSLFCKLRPFWIKPPTSRDRDTCQCKLHENLTYKLETAHSNKLINSKHINDIVKTVTCNKSLDNKNCMYRSCLICKNKTVPIDTNVDLGKQVQWKMWKSRRVATHVRVVRETECGSLETLVTDIEKEVERAARHIYNIRHQYHSITSLKENMATNELLIHMDFSENYNCKLDSEIQSMHFGASQRQVSVHNGIIYSKEKIYPFATVSDCLMHSPAGIWGHLQPVFDFLKTMEHEKNVIHFLSDGPTTQYRNKTNMFMFSFKIFDLGYKYGTWNYLEAGHGKGATDGIGATVKRTADSFVLTGHDVKCAEDLKCALNGSSIHVFVVTESDIIQIDKALPMAAEIKAVPQTMRIHQKRSPDSQSHGTGVSAETNIDTTSDNILRNETMANASSTDFVVNVDIPEVASVDASGDKGTPDNSAEKISMFYALAAPGLLKPVLTVDQHLIGQYIVVEYDGLPYPGEVLDVDEEDLEVKVMHKIGKNRFFWPLLDDTLWYHKDKVVTILDGAPVRVTGRHCKINHDVWDQIEDILDL